MLKMTHIIRLRNNNIIYLCIEINLNMIYCLFSSTIKIKSSKQCIEVSIITVSIIIYYYSPV